MISMNNFKLLTDLKNELNREKSKLELLKKSSETKMIETVHALFERLKGYFQHQNFEIEERNDKISTCFVAKYNDGLIETRLFNGSYEVSVQFYDVTTYQFVLVPTKSEYKSHGQLKPEDDMLTKEILDIYRKIDEVKSLVRSYENNKYSFALRNVDDTLTYLGNQEKLLEILFKP